MYIYYFEIFLNKKYFKSPITISNNYFIYLFAIHITSTLEEWQKKNPKIRRMPWSSGSWSYVWWCSWGDCCCTSKTKWFWDLVRMEFAARLAARHSNPNAGHARSEHSCGSTQPKARTQNKFKYTLLDPWKNLNLFHSYQSLDLPLHFFLLGYFTILAFFW